jgi:hypothetical protein
LVAAVGFHAFVLENGMAFVEVEEGAGGDGDNKLCQWQWR